MANDYVMDDETPQKAKDSPMQLVLAVVGVTILALLFGGGLGYLLYQQAESSVTQKLKVAEADKKPELKLTYQDTLMVKPLPPVVTNLKSPPNTFIRIEAVVLFNRDDVPDVDALAAQISEDIIVFVRNLRLSQIEGSVGLDQLREDLNERASIRSDGKVQELLLHTVVAE